MKKGLIIGGSCLFALVLVFMGFLWAKKIKSANFTNASATLSNSRLSYKASVSSGSSGSSVVTIDTGSADQNTNHLFPKDTICFANSAESGCIGNTTYTVANIVDSTHFNVTGALGDNLTTSDFVVATQSGSLALSFTTATEIPADGDILVTIPALNTDNKTDDGFPDTGALTAVNGFDIGAMTTSDVTVTGCTDVNWSVASVTAGTSSSDHLILINRSTSACSASTTITVTIDSSPGLINPAPISGHSQGAADSYTVNVKSRDGSNNTLDESDVKIAPVEGVIVSATVDETLSLTIAGVTANDTTTYCGITRTATSPDTTAYSVPWGTISPTYSSTTHDTQQTVTVSTNADGGYNVYIEENDQMGKSGVACTGNGGESINCIQDTVCSAAGCDESTLRDWTADPSSYVGLGYSLEDISGTDAVFEYDDSGAAFNAKQIADIAASETRQSIMTNAGPVSGSSAAVCFRIDITATQPAGYYYNKIKYTAVATF